MSDSVGIAHVSGPSRSNGTSAAGQTAAQKAAQKAGQGREAVTHAAGDIKGTAKEQAQRVGAEAQAQVRTIAAEVRDKLGEQARAQSDTLVTSIRQAADNLDEMRGDRQDSPAATVVARVADGGRQLADYLDRHGPDGVLQEVQDFARRRPGAFLATALAAGFVVGRLGKSITQAASGAPAASEASAASGASADSRAPGGSEAPAVWRGGGAEDVPAPVTMADPQALLDEFTRLQQHRVARP